MAPDGLVGALPNQTLYIRNLNERLHKDKLRKALFSCFSQFGSIIDIVALKTYRLRGQAWVVFNDIASATNAKQQLQDFVFYDKPLDIHFARSKSDAVAKLDGTFKPRPKRKREEQGAHSDSVVGDDDDTEMDLAEGGGPAPPKRLAAPKPQAPPHHVLLATELPEECNAAMLQMLFQQYSGFKEARMVPGRMVAFIEFDTEPNATVALQGLRNFKLTPTSMLQLDYAKK